MSEWFKITDITTGSELFNGSSIYAYIQSAVFSGGNNIGNKPIQGVNTELDSILDGSNESALGSNYDRRMGLNSYSSFNNPSIKLTGNWTEETGSLNQVGSILTPFKFWKIINSDHQFKLEGGIIIPNITAGESGSGYYMDLGGFPVVFTTPWQMT